MRRTVGWPITRIISEKQILGDEYWTITVYCEEAEYCKNFSITQSDDVWVREANNTLLQLEEAWKAKLWGTNQEKTCTVYSRAKQAKPARCVPCIQEGCRAAHENPLYSRLQTIKTMSCTTVIWNEKCNQNPYVVDVENKCRQEELQPSNVV